MRRALLLGLAGFFSLWLCGQAAVPPATSSTPTDYAPLIHTGTIVGAWSTTNISADGGTTTALTAGVPYIIQCDVAVWFVGTTSTGVVTSTTGIRIEAFQQWPFMTSGTKPAVAIKPVSGTANCVIEQRS